MEATLHRFVRLLRLGGLRVSIPEALDAMRCAGQPGVLTSRATLRTALLVALVKDQRDEPVFDEIFDAFFSLVRVGGHESSSHGHAHDDLVDSGELESFTLSEEPGDKPEEGHEHGKPASIREYFKREDLAQQYNLHQEANKIDIAALTDQIVLSKESAGADENKYRVQLSADRLHGAGPPGSLSTSPGTSVDASLTIAEQDALLGWLDELANSDDGDETDAAALRRKLTGVLENLPQALKRHLEALLALENAIVENRAQREATLAGSGRLPEAERAELEESLRRLARSLRGALTHRRRTSAAGRVDSSQTMRRNMRFDGIPFVPVTMRRAEDRPRLVVLADVSLSVRATSRFTLSLVHGLQDLFTQVRSFAFVADIAETTELFRDYQTERALGLIFGGDVVDTDANSDYGAVFGEFLAEHASAVTRRTTVVVLGDGRNNANDPNLAAFEEITRRARETVWLTPEPRFSWGLGGCDLPAYAEHCSRVRVVRDLRGLERTAQEFATDTSRS